VSIFRARPNVTSIPFPLALHADAAPPRVRYSGIALVVALHAAALAAWWLHAPARDAVSMATPILVRLIAAPPSPPSPRHSEPPKPHRARVTPPLPTIEPLTTPPIEFIAPIAAPRIVAHVETLAANESTTAQREDTSAHPSAVAPAAPAQAPVEPSFSAEYLRNPAPAYPAASRRNGEQGTVLLRVQVDADGDPMQIEIQRSSGFDRLDQAARGAVRRWKFVPGTRDGMAITAWVVIPLTFSLR
jgi:protein TonB